MTTARLDTRQFAMCCCTVLAALLPHASWLPLPFLGLLLGMIALRWLQRWRWPRVWPWWFHTGLMLSLFAAAWGSIGTISGTQGAGFLAAMMVSKLYEAERVRDARSVATFASFLVMAQFLFQSELWAMLAAIPGMVLAIATLASLHQVPTNGPITVARPLRQAGLLILVALPFALALFAVFPRLVSPLWGNTFSTQRGQLGLGDRMEPGQLGESALDDRPALRVRFPDGVPPSPLRYFRGLTLWSTDGRAWTRPEWTDAPMLDLPPVPDRGIRHEITLEPDAAPWLPALDRPIAAPDGLRLALDSSLPMPRRNRALRYEVVSDPDLMLEPFGLSPQTESMALALPQSRNPRTLALAQRLREETPDAEAFARRLLGLFTEEFSYALEPPPLGVNSVDEFLFDTKIGYCEHYASAYATLLRAGGVPARVVLGYQGGYYNAMGGYLVVRRADAHAWVESWIEGRGWLRADPTSMVAPERIELGSGALAGLQDDFRRSDLFRWFHDRWDFLELRWTDWIVNYRAAEQSALLQHLMNRLPQSFTAMGAMIVAMIVISAVLIFWLLRGRPAGQAMTDPSARWFGTFRRVLAGAGVASTPSEPMTRIAARAGERYPSAARVLAELTSRYQATRYAPGGDGRAARLSRRALADLWLKLQKERLRRLMRPNRRPS